MTRPANSPGVPGTILLKLAPLFFSEHFISAVVHPTIADFQTEFADAGGSRVKRLRARWRGYRAFWSVALAAPFASWAAPAPDRPGVASARAAGYLAVGATTLVLLALTRAMLGISGAVVTAAGVLCALLIHAWYERHPTDVLAARDQVWRSPQINFSSMDVAGNIGGLIFVVGSILVVVLGLPSVLWFLLAGGATGSLLAWRLAAWHARHPTWGLPENRIVLR
jgi:hypothetical protein